MQLVVKGERSYGEGLLTVKRRKNSYSRWKRIDQSESRTDNSWKWRCFKDGKWKVTVNNRLTKGIKFSIRFIEG